MGPTREMVGIPLNVQNELFEVAWINRSGLPHDPSKYTHFWRIDWEIVAPCSKICCPSQSTKSILIRWICWEDGQSLLTISPGEWFQMFHLGGFLLAYSIIIHHEYIYTYIYIYIYIYKIINIYIYIYIYMSLYVYIYTYIHRLYHIYIILYYITLYYIMLYYIILHYIILCYIILYYIILYYVILYYITLYYVILYYIILYVIF